MAHAILGPGGVGGLVGAVLAHAGEPVTVIVRSGVLDYHPRELSLESPFGSFSVPVSVSACLDQPVEVLWVVEHIVGSRPDEPRCTGRDPGARGSRSFATQRRAVIR